MTDSFEPADFSVRVKAGVVDFGGAILTWLFLAWIGLPLFGLLLCSAYILLRDSLDGQSFGKKWQKIIAVNLETNRPCMWMDSVMRNLFVFLPIVGPPWALVEMYYAMQDSDYRRVGDRFANTAVVSLPAAQEKAPPAPVLEKSIEDPSAKKETSV